MKRPKRLWDEDDDFFFIGIGLALFAIFSICAICILPQKSHTRLSSNNIGGLGSNRMR